MRRPAAAADKERMAELNEELTADFKKGTFIFALQKEEKGIPLVKLKDGQLYQPAFTDIWNSRNSTVKIRCVRL